MRVSGHGQAHLGQRPSAGRGSLPTRPERARDRCSLAWAGVQEHRGRHPGGGAPAPPAGPLPAPPEADADDDPELAAVERELLEVRGKVEGARDGSLRNYLAAVSAYVGFVERVRKLRPPPPPDDEAEAAAREARAEVLGK